MARRRERPLKFTNPSGKTVWKARWTDRNGKRRLGWKPDIPGTYELRKDAQEAIEACYEREEQGPLRPETVGGYFAVWQQLHPRAKVTDKTNRSRVGRMLDVKLERAPLRDWPFDQLRRRHANILVDYMLREEGRAQTGVKGVLAALSAMAEDAIEDEVILANPFRGVRLRKTDPRIQKHSRKITTYSWQEMRDFAKAAGEVSGKGDLLNDWRRIYAEPMIRTLSDCGVRIGELLVLCHRDVDFKEATMEVRWSTVLGDIMHGTKHDHGEQNAGRVVPVPPDLLRMMSELPMTLSGFVWRGDQRGRLLFPSPKGVMFSYPTFYKQVWEPTREATGMTIRPHEMRHSWVSLMRAAGINPADLAAVAGHSETTATRRYTHALGRSDEAIRRVVGS